MMLLVSLGLVLNRLIATEIEISEKFSDGISAYYAAEAGVKRALVEIDNHTTYNNFTEILKNSEYYVTIKDDADRQLKVVTAVGQSNQAVRKATAYVSVAESPCFACYSGRSMVLNTKVIGRVGLHGRDITIYPGGSIANLNGVLIQPELDVANFKLPPIRTSFNEKKYEHAQPLANVLSGSRYALKGVYYVDGDFRLNGAALLANGQSDATIFVKGNAELTGDIVGNITIIATNKVTINNIGGNSERIICIYANREILVSQPVEGQVLLMAKGDIYVNGLLHGVIIAQGSAFVDSPVEGSVLADQAVRQSSSGEVKYDEHIFNNLGITRPQVMAWDF
jgi:hypothetical protein